MDKYEFNIKVEQIKKMVTRGDFETSMRIADTIDWRRVRSANLLSMISQVYEKNGEYQEAKEVLLLAYERAPIGKRLLFKLTELALKEGSIREAEDYYREFCDLAQDDSRQYLLRYMILKEKKVPVEQLIGCLEHYVSQELDERWMYELASLYEKAGQQHKCVQMCDRIMLMFAFGKYVDKAMDLKVRYAPLSEYQLDLMKNRGKYEAKLKVVEQKFDENTLGGYEEDDDFYLNSSEPAESYGGGQYAQDSYSQDGYGQGGYQQEQGSSFVSEPYGGQEYGQGTYPQEVYANQEYGQGYEPQGMSGQGSYPQGGYTGQEYSQGNYPQEGYAGQGQEYGQGNYPQGGYVGQGQEYGQENYPQGAYAGQGQEYSQGNYPQGGYAGQGQGYSQENYPQGGYAGQKQEYDQESYLQGSYTGQGQEYSQESYPQGGYAGQGQEYSQGNYPQGGYAGQGQEYGQESYPQGAYAGQGQEYSQGNYPQGAYVSQENQQESYPHSDSQQSYIQGVYKQADNSRVGYALEPQQQAMIREEDGHEGSYSQEEYFQKSYVSQGYPQVNIPQEQYPQEGRYQSQGNYFENEEDNGFSYDQREVENPEDVSGFSEGQVSVQEDSKAIDEELVVNFHQDHIEHELAKEMSKISEERTVEQEPVSMQTKVPQAGQDHAFQIQDDQSEQEPEELPSAPMSGHLLIEAKTPEKGLETAIEILKQIHAESGGSRPVAKITGSKLNQKGISNIIDMLAGKDLVVEEAGDLSDKELIGLQQLVAEDTSGMNIILIDNPRQLEELYQQNPELTCVFECVSSEQSELVDSEGMTKEESHRQEEENLPLDESQSEPVLPEPEAEKEIEPEQEMELEPVAEKEDGYESEMGIQSESEPEREPELEEEPEFEREPELEGEFETQSEFESGLDTEPEFEPDNDEELDIDQFAEYATHYAGEIDCSITGKSMLALYERIDIMEEDGIPLTRANAEELIEAAADRAEKPPISKLIKGMFTSKYDKDGLLILREEHFK